MIEQITLERTRLELSSMISCVIMQCFPRGDQRPFASSTLLLHLDECGEQTPCHFVSSDPSQ